MDLLWPILCAGQEFRRGPVGRNKNARGQGLSYSPRDCAVGSAAREVDAGNVIVERGSGGNQLGAKKMPAGL
jgi:hypothetical protein